MIKCFPGPKWHQRRKILTPAFHFNILRKFCSTIEDNTQRLVEVLARTEGDKVDIVPILSEFTLNSICGMFCPIQLDKGALSRTQLPLRIMLSVPLRHILRHI